MNDPFQNHKTGLDSPAVQLHAVTPSDTADLPSASRGINVATSGIVKITTVGGTTGAIYVVAGVVFPVRVTRVWATGTTATGIMALS